MDAAEQALESAIAKAEAAAAAAKGPLAFLFRAQLEVSAPCPIACQSTPLNACAS